MCVCLCARVLLRGGGNECLCKSLCVCVREREKIEQQCLGQ